MGRSQDWQQLPLSVEELDAIVERLDATFKDIAGRGLPLPELLGDVWGSSVAVVRGSVRFLQALDAELCKEPATDWLQVSALGQSPPEAVLGAAECLRNDAAALEAARLHGHVAMLSRHEAVFSEPSLAPAVCARCRQLCEWAPSYFKAARRSVSEGLTELRQHRAEWAVGLERDIARERHRLRRLVEDELEVLLTARSTTSQTRVPNSEHRGQKQQQQQQQQQEQPLQCGFVVALNRWAEEFCSSLQLPGGSVQFEELLQRKADEVMEAVDSHLESAWECSVAAWGERALRPRVLLLEPSVEIDRGSSGDEAQPCSSSSAEVESIEVIALDEAMPAPAKPVDAFASPPAQQAPRSPSDATLHEPIATTAPDAWSTPLPSPGPQTPLGAVFRAVELATSSMRTGTHRSPRPHNRPRSLPSKLPSSAVANGVGGRVPPEMSLPLHTATPAGSDAALRPKGASMATTAGIAGRGVRSNRVVIGEAATPARLQCSRTLSRVSLRTAATDGMPTKEACFKPYGGRDVVIQDYTAYGKHLSPFATKPAHTKSHVRSLTRSTTTSASSAER
mmetsp:Transcript_92659/g.183903  ORF Transcript_92659/g.183903 Transcript_92659/m.183903 type:complete len:565 (-) Transcript_92659:48-1742(-)